MDVLSILQGPANNQLASVHSVLGTDRVSLLTVP